MAVSTPARETRHSAPHRPSSIRWRGGTRPETAPVDGARHSGQVGTLVVPALCDRATTGGVWGSQITGDPHRPPVIESRRYGIPHPGTSGGTRPGAPEGQPVRPGRPTRGGLKKAHRPLQPPVEITARETATTLHSSSVVNQCALQADPCPYECAERNGRLAAFQGCSDRRRLSAERWKGG
jgi:hypothetical protein